MVKHKKILIGLLIAVFTTTVFAKTLSYYDNQIKLYRYRIEQIDKTIDQEQKKVDAIQKIIDREQKKLNVLRQKILGEHNKRSKYEVKIQKLLKERDKEYPPKKTAINKYNPLDIQNERVYNFNQKETERRINNQ